jgi:hypothetical protein
MRECDAGATRHMQVTLDIPDDVAERLMAAGGDLSRCALEALALEEYKHDQLTKPELRRLLGFGQPRCEFEPCSLDDLARERGVTWNGLVLSRCGALRSSGRRISAIPPEIVDALLEQHSAAKT